MRPRMLGTAAAVLGTALGLGWLLSRATTQVVNWFVMTDELFYACRGRSRGCASSTSGRASR